MTPRLTPSTAASAKPSAVTVLAAMRKAKRAPLNRRDRQLLAMPAIDQAFPHVFANGVTIKHVTGRCAECGTAQPVSQMNGSVTTCYPHVIIVEAICACPTCGSPSRYLARFTDDMRYATLSDSGWREGRLRATSFLNRAGARLGAFAIRVLRA